MQHNLLYQQTICPSTPLSGKNNKSSLIDSINNQVAWINIKYFPSRWLHWILNYSYMIIVPYCYIRIFLFRKNRVAPGEKTMVVKREEIRKRKRNAVTFKYNISIWILETFSAFIPLVLSPLNFDVGVWSVFIHFYVYLCLSPALYLLGMRE